MANLLKNTDLLKKYNNYYATPQFLKNVRKAYDINDNQRKVIAVDPVSNNLLRFKIPNYNNAVKLSKNKYTLINRKINELKEKVKQKKNKKIKKNKNVKLNKGGKNVKQNKKPKRIVVNVK